MQVDMDNDADQVINAEANVDQDVDHPPHPVEVMPVVHVVAKPKEHSYENSMHLL
jgi:hypothetical protein